MSLVRQRWKQVSEPSKLMEASSVWRVGRHQSDTKPSQSEALGARQRTLSGDRGGALQSQPESRAALRTAARLQAAKSSHLLWGSLGTVSVYAGIEPIFQPSTAFKASRSRTNLLPVSNKSPFGFH